MTHERDRRTRAPAVARRADPGTRRVLYACAAAVAVLVDRCDRPPGLRLLVEPAGDAGRRQLHRLRRRRARCSWCSSAASTCPIPWVLNGAAIVLTTTSLGQTGRLPLAIALALGVGAAVGFVNGMGVAWLRRAGGGDDAGHERRHAGAVARPVQGTHLRLVRVVRAGAAAPPVRRHGRWASRPSCSSGRGVALLMTVLLTLTTFGRRVYAVGQQPARRVPGRRRRCAAVTVALYTLSGVFAAARRHRAGRVRRASPRSGSATRTCSSPSPPSWSAECPSWAVAATTSASSPARSRWSPSSRFLQAQAGARVRAQHHLRPRHPRDPLHLRPGQSNA